MNDKLVRLGTVLQAIDPDLVGDPKTIAKSFLAKNPEYVDLISDEIRDILTRDTEESYIWPFHSVTSIEADRQAKIKSRMAQLDMLAKGYDLLEAMRLNVPVSVLGQAKLAVLSAQLTELAEESRHRRQLDADEKRHEWATDTLDQTARITKDLNDNDVQNQLLLLGDEIDRKLKELHDTNAEKLQNLDKLLDFRRKKFEEEMKQRKQRLG
jgi:hypothetical protein